MSSDDKGTKWLYGIGGAAIGALGAYLLDHHDRGDDEDRPPILVKDGSLIFQSGDPMGAGNEKKGKPWQSEDDDWQPDHSAGKPIKWLYVEVTLASGDAVMARTRRIEITYGTKRFDIAINNQIGKGGKDCKLVPTISGPGLTPEGTADNPTLVHDKGGTGKITKVEFKDRQKTMSYASPKLIRILQE